MCNIPVLSEPAKDIPWEYAAVLFVPQTPAGELAGALWAYEWKR